MIASVSKRFCALGCVRSLDMLFFLHVIQVHQGGISSTVFLILKMVLVGSFSSGASVKR